MQRKQNKPSMPGWVYMELQDDFKCRVKLGKYKSTNVFEDFEFYTKRGFSCSLDNMPDGSIVMHAAM